MKFRLIFSVVFLSIAQVLLANPIINTNCGADDGFPLSVDSIQTTVFCDSSEAEVVKLASGFLCNDIEMVTGRKLVLTDSTENLTDYAVIIGTTESPLIQDLVNNGKINIDSIDGKWESFQLQTIDAPIAGVTKALVIVGSDRRACAYGVFELSKSIGVSPWYWWADVTPASKDEIYICSLNYTSNEPTVKYRGIFINDEDWGLQEWSQYTFDPVQDIGPTTYAKVFELLLRLKANYLWPAMHPCTEAFAHYPDNKVMADKYAIIMGSSHHEPLLYNTETWSSGEWNPFTNMDGVMAVQEESVKTRGMFENVYTVGMRSTGDSGLPGGGTEDERTDKLEEVIDRQRELLKEHVDSNILEVPQVFWPYKEVLEMYNNNMDVPEDITLGWVDDNHGYIRQVSNPEEQARSGGSGVYYHISYWGSPADYLWIASTSPALIATEMKKAADFGSDRVWIFNVGDIKPAEMLTNFCLDLAYDYNKWDASNVRDYLIEWSSYTFGEEYAEVITTAYLQYFKLAQASKPEHINRVDFSDSEVDARLSEYDEIATAVEEIKGNIPEDLQDAFFQMVYYPIVGATLMNEKFLYAHKSFRGIELQDTMVLFYSQKSKDAYNKIKEITNHYNTGIKNGKWNRIISDDIRSQAVYDMPDVADQTDLDNRFSPLADIDFTTGIYEAPMKNENGIVYGDSPGYVEKANGGKAEYTFYMVNNVSADVYFYAQTPTPEEDSWYIDINGTSFVQNDYATGSKYELIKVRTLTLKAGKNKITINQRESNAKIAAIKIVKAGTPTSYIEPNIKNPAIVIPAWTFNKRQDASNYTWTEIEGLSTSEKAVVNLPYTLPSVENVANAPYIEQDIEVEGNDLTFEIRCMPTRRLYEGRDLRMAISINNEEPQIISINHLYPSAEWTANVLRGFTNHSINFNTNDSIVNLKLYALDPGVIFDKVLVFNSVQNVEQKITSLQNILLDSVGMEGFSPDKFEYEIILPEGLNGFPEILGIASDESCYVVIEKSVQKKTVTIEVIANNGSTNSIYTLVFSGIGIGKNASGK